MKKEEKTNVMRVLDAKKISYESHNYVDSGAISGTEVAKALGRIRMRYLKHWLP